MLVVSGREVRTRRPVVNDPDYGLIKVFVYEYWDDVRFGLRVLFTISSIYIV